MNRKSENVIILGASDSHERYSYKALKKLQEHGHRVFLVHPKLKEIEGISCYSSLSEIAKVFPDEEFDTLTVYVRPEISTPLKEEITKLKLKRVIFNPGTENDKIYNYLAKNDIDVETACTLVLLQTGQF